MNDFLVITDAYKIFSCYEIEKKTKTEKKYLYPNFEMINWFAGAYLLEQIIEINLEESRCPENLLIGLKALHHSLKHWNNEKDVCAGLISN